MQVLPHTSSSLRNERSKSRIVKEFIFATSHLRYNYFGFHKINSVYIQSAKTDIKLLIFFFKEMQEEDISEDKKRTLREGLKQIHPKQHRCILSPPTPTHTHTSRFAIVCSKSESVIWVPSLVAVTTALGGEGRRTRSRASRSTRSQTC